MKIRKSLAGVAAFGLAATGIAVATAPAATAAGFSGTGVSACHLYFGSGLPGTPAGDSTLGVSNSTFAITGLSLSNYAPNAGEVVTVTLTSTGFTTGPAPVAVGGLGLNGVVELSGAQTGTVAVTNLNAGGSGAYPASATPGNTAMGSFTLTGTFTASGNGAIAVAYKQLEAHDNSGSGANNWCDGTAAGTSVVSPPASAGTAQTTNFSAGPPVVGFKVTTILAGVYTWVVPSTWDPKFAAASSASIKATATVTGPNASVSSINGQAAGVTGYARSTNVLSLAGTVWGANVAAGGFTATVGGATATNDLTTDASGVLSGTVTVPAGATTGLTTIALTQGANTSTTPITILANAAFSISPANGGPGTSISVTGTSFNPSSPHYVFAYLNKPGAAYVPCGGTVIGPFAPVDSNCPASAGTTQIVTSSASGTLSASVSATANMVGVMVVEALPASTWPLGIAGSQSNGRAAIQAFTVNSDTCIRQTGTSTVQTCETKQNLNATVNPGSLSQTANAYAGAGYTSTLIPLGAVTTSTTSQTLPGHINPITVTDARGGTATWTLTASLNSLTSGSNSIANVNLALGGVTCAPQAGSASGITSGTGGTFDSTQTICDATTNTATSTGGTKGGEWVADAPLTLTVPAYQAAGAYAGTITFTLT